MTRYFCFLLLTLALSCGHPYQKHATISGAPREDRPYAEQVVGQAAHHAVPVAASHILAGWRIELGAGLPSRAICEAHLIQVDPSPERWRDHLAHEVTHAVLCELRPGLSEKEHHKIMGDSGLCYGSPACLD